MTVSTDIVIHILDVNDNPPYLVGDYSASYLCTPQREKQSIIISAFDQDGAENSIPFSFSLANDPTHQRNWRINIINGMYVNLGFIMENGSFSIAGEKTASIRQ